MHIAVKFMCADLRFGFLRLSTIKKCPHMLRAKTITALALALAGDVSRARAELVYRPMASYGHNGHVNKRWCLVEHYSWSNFLIITD